MRVAGARSGGAKAVVDDGVAVVELSYPDSAMVGTAVQQIAGQLSFDRIYRC